ncbi:multiple pdz domain protein [Plakobranchus ocellatus]|uniref:Multiple pdz domain protein n=1 Tax=Plakobranchus ocellatus TaxID=259542 RepID=A0AAV4BJB4_9GAST|nr:multiple pdz domain protein [Plakobranchus ocellatus]
MKSGFGYGTNINTPLPKGRDGRLQEGDQLLAINGQALEVSHQEAIRILQSAHGTAEIVVARGSAEQQQQYPQQDLQEQQQLQEEEEEEEERQGSPAVSPRSAGSGEPAAEVLSQAEQAAASAPASPRTAGEADEEGGGEDAEEDDEGSAVEGEDGKLGQDKSDMVLSTDWTQLEVIDLINDGTGLGFGIIGGRSTGVVVKTILPGGIADLTAKQTYRDCARHGGTRANETALKSHEFEFKPVIDALARREPEKNCHLLDADGRHARKETIWSWWIGYLVIDESDMDRWPLDPFHSYKEFAKRRPRLEATRLVMANLKD